MLAALDHFDPQRFAVLLDVDGTILDLAATPHAVVVPEALRHTLVQLLKRTRGALALVSGRPIADLDHIFAPLRLPAVGGHGAEIRPGAHDTSYEQQASTLDPGLKLQLKDIATRYPDVAFEDKGYSLAVHYRLAIEHEIDVVEQVFHVCKAYPIDSYEILTGKAVIEVKARGFDKGTAVRRLMTYPPFTGRTPIFIGDDTTDEAAFAVMPDFDGIPISVGRKVPGIAGRFQSPVEVRRWLERLSNETVVAP